MKIGKTQLVPIYLFLLAAIPAYCQRGTIGLDVGQTSDRFGGAARVSDLEADLEGQVSVLRGGGKNNLPSLVAGGEARFPANTQKHATEYALFAGPAFHFGSHFSAGFHAQVRKIDLPPSIMNGQVFNRLNMELLELPFVAEYKFGSAPRHAFLEAQIAPEFSPHYKTAAAGPPPVPKPQFDHGYTIRGSAGYVFGRWYAKATYETRYFKFTQSIGNPNELYNWRTNRVTGAVGFVF
jgi:hypothetical protein